jgi:hypothetical protein
MKKCCCVLAKGVILLIYLFVEIVIDKNILI